MVKNNLWIANENLDGVIIVDENGIKLKRIQIKKPVGVHYDSDLNIVFVGSKKGKVSLLFIY
jgi:hypothetical protein